MAAPIKLSDRERNLLIITIGFAVFYVFYQFLLTPKWDEINRLKNTARDQRLEMKIADGKVKILDAIEKSAGLMPERSEMPREEKALEVLRLLSQATVKSGLNINFIKPLLEETGEGLKFSLSCSGKYRNFYNFFQILYRLHILVLIDSLDISSNGGREPSLDIKLALTAYY
jgi:Tfp pilus assembly protein PilO